MTNKEQYEILANCVKQDGAKNFCFCKKDHKRLFPLMEQAQADPQLVIKVACARFTHGGCIAGMRGCCLSAGKFLEVAAKVLETDSPKEGK